MLRSGIPRARAWGRMVCGFVLAACMVGLGGAHAAAQGDPLPSWNDTAPKKAIIDFVARVTAEEGTDYVRPEERIAVFDNDGTLWAEQPIYFQVAFAIDRIAAMAPEHPDWEQTQPYKAILDGDMKALAEFGQKGILEI